jgi:hypothetical protein
MSLPPGLDITPPERKKRALRAVAEVPTGFASEATLYWILDVPSDAEEEVEAGIKR